MIFLFLLPVLAIASAVLMWRANGRRQFLQFDIVQFVYAFVISPLVFIWFKGAMHFLFAKELQLRLSANELFVADTLFSVVFLYIFAFVVIHSLTKSFELKKNTDPLYDIFEHSEFFHLTASHLVVYLGAMLLLTFLSVTNVFVPFVWQVSQSVFYLTLGSGVVAGLVGFTGVWLYAADYPNFLRIMKLSFGLFFGLHVALNYIFEPAFSARYSIYWFSLALFLTTVLISLFAEKREEPSSFWKKATYKLNPFKVRYYFKFLAKRLRLLWAGS